MEIANNILKHYLKDVYFFCGTSCGGKTTMSKIFAEKHGLLWLDEDTLNQQTANIAEPAYQPALCSALTEEELYNLPYKEFHQRLYNMGGEMLPLMLLEAVRLSANRKAAIDMYNMPPKLALELTEPNRIVFLVTSPESVVRDNYNRPGHERVSDSIMRMSDPQATLENCNKMLAYAAQCYLDELYESGLFYIMRDDNSTIEHTLALVEKHFGV